MKKLSNMLLAALAMLAAASCNKEIDDVQENIPAQNGKVTILTARLDEGTKTSLDGVDIVWTAADAITAFDETGKAYTSTATTIEEEGAVAKFSVPTESPVYAVYPAYAEGAEEEMTDGKIAATIPSRQNVVAESFADGANVAVAYVSDPDDMHFKNVGGLLAVKIKETTRTIVSIKIAAKEALTGDILTSIDEENTVTTVFSEAEGAEKATSVTLTAQEGSFPAGTYYAVVAPGTYTGVTIVFEDEDGHTATYSKKTDLTVERNSNQLLGGFSIPEDKWTQTFTKVTSVSGLRENGSYLIVYEGDATHDAVAFNGALTTLDAAKNGVSVSISDDHTIEMGTEAIFTISVDNGTIQSASGKYIGVSSNSNGLQQEDNTSTYTNAFSFDDSGNAVISAVFSGSTMTLRYNYASDNLRFRYYKSGQRPIALYLLEGSGTAPKADPELAYETTSYEVTLGESFTAPTLTNPNSLTVTYASSDASVATVDSSTGEVTLVAAGSTTITATFDGNDTYKAGSASYTLTVNPAGASTIAEVIAGSVGETYTVEDVVVYAIPATTTAIIGDDTGKMLLYLKDHGLAVGDVITVTGSTTTYNGIAEFTNSPTVEKTGTTTVDHGTATTLTSTNLTAWQDAPEIVYVTGNGTQSGRVVTVEGVQLYLNTTYSGTDGRAVTTTGYLYGWTSSYGGEFYYYPISLAIDESVSYLNVSAVGSWAAGEYGSENAKTITVTLNDDASGYSVSYTDTNNEWSVSDNGSGAITVYPLAANESESDPKELEITITHDDDSSLTETVTLTQAKVTEAPTSVSYDFTGSDWSVSNGTLSNGTVSFTGSGSDNFKMNNGYFMMGKSGAYITFPTYSYPVTKIVVTGKSGASASTKQNIFVGTTAVSTETTGATGTNTYNINSDYQTAGTTYILKVTSSHNTQITKIEVFFN